MKGLISGWKRILDGLSAPRYPEYQEYRDSGYYDDSDRPQDEAAGAPRTPADEVAKIQRIKILAVIVIIGSSALAAFFFFTEKPPAQAPQARTLRNVLTNEVARELEPGGRDAARHNESLEEIKQWAAEMDAQLQREMRLQDSAPPMSPDYYGQNRRPTDTSVYREMVMLPPLETNAVSPRPEGGGTMAAPAAVEPSPSPGDHVAPASAPPFSAPASQQPVVQETPPGQDTLPGRYQRRQLEPIEIQPWNIDPY